MGLFDLLPRVLTFSLERHWIEYIGFLMEYHLPKHDPADWVGRLTHVLFVSMILLAIADIFQVLGVRQMEHDRDRLDHQLIHMKQQQRK